MSIADLNQSIKNKKNSYSIFFADSFFNHPHRIPKVAVSGTLNYTIDGRDFIPTPITSATKYEFSLDYSLSDPWIRVFQANYPWRTFAPPTILAQGEFTPGHRPHSPWEFRDTTGDPTDIAVIGTCTKTTYTRTLIIDPWTAGTPVVTDISHKFFPSISGGGDIFSGGRGAGSDAEKTQIEYAESYDGAEYTRLPNFSDFIFRLPWDDPWASETAIFATVFSDFLADGNSTDGGGHSGTCSLSLDFA